jgi:cation diffusion facilitator family transporter
MNTKTIKTNEQIAMTASVISLGGNVLLSVVKLFAGVFAHSAAMVSDAVHSFSDVLSTVIVMVGIKVSGRQPDKEHPYGHERLECVAAILLSAILLATSLGIGWSGLQTIFTDNSKDIPLPGVFALAAAIFSIVCKELLYGYPRQAAKKIDSSSLMAAAWDHRSDALSSVGSFVGILGARLGLPILDPLASIVISLFILLAAVGIFRDALVRMTDHACDDETVEILRGFIAASPGVSRLDDLKTRVFNSRVYIDIEIAADSTLSLIESHKIAEDLHKALETEFPKIKHCTIHVNPD